MKHDAHIAHHVAGRLRIRIPSARNNPVMLEQMTGLFAGLPGLEGVAVKAESGSLVVHYDPARESEFAGHFAQYARQAAPPPRPPRPENEAEMMVDEIEAEAEYLAAHSHSVRIVVDLFKQVDTEIRRATNNMVDLKIVLALGLAVVTFAGVGAHAATPMWITLALFALNHFVEMHPPKATERAAA